MKKQQKKLYNILKRDKNLTSFQKRVYRAVLTIPYGKVKTYKWVAEKSGIPSSHRAVGNALKKNPYVGKVPCHRVIKSDGTLGGFSKGAEEKARLLKREGLDVGQAIKYNTHREGAKYA